MHPFLLWAAACVSSTPEPRPPLASDTALAVDSATSTAMSDSTAPRPSCALGGPIRKGADLDHEFIGLAPHDRLGNQLLAVGDLTGDGMPDLVVGSDHGGKVYVLAGGAPWTDGPIDEAAYAVLDGGPDSVAGSSLSAAGDVDGDGRVDLWIGDRTLDDFHGGAYLVRAADIAPGEQSLPDLAHARLLGQARFDGSAKVIGLGDLDGDGIDEVALTSDVHGDGRGKVAILRGPFAGEHRSDEAFATFEGQAQGDALTRALSLGDFDDDGHVDLALFATGVRSGSGAVFVQRGPVTEADVATLDGLEGAAGALLGKSAALLDVDADGRSELWVGAPYDDGKRGAVYVIDALPSGALPVAEASSGSFHGLVVDDRVGFSVSDAGDLDGDGVGEVFVSAKGESSLAPSGGAVFVVSGRPAGAVSLDETVYRLKVASDRPLDFFGRGVAAGDLSGDGLPDLVLAGPSRDVAGEDAGAVSLHPCAL